MKNNKKGFTLIELLIVIAILGILSAVSIASLSSIKDKARDTTRITELGQIRKALEIYYGDYGHYPYFRNAAYAGTGHWTDAYIANNWNDFIYTLNEAGVITNPDIQDPSFGVISTYSNSYQYMPSNNPASSTLPDNFRIRVKLEKDNNPILTTGLTGAFLYTDEFHDSDSATHRAASCTPAEGWYCLGPKENFTAFRPGKPVIYLYPTEETEVAVNVTTKRITESIPDYGDGWNVTAYPDGTIKNQADDQTYPYLFWEGVSSKPYVDRNYGFVTATDQIESFLAEKLTAQGLESKEYDEFIEYWAPRMKSKDYVYVYFMPQTDYDKFIPMEISPQPDTIIRVYMLYKSIDEPIKVEAQKLSAPPRKGFTVVEWGGDRSELK